MASVTLTRQEKRRIKQAVVGDVDANDMPFVKRWSADLLHYLGFFEEARASFPSLSVDQLINMYKEMLLNRVLVFVRNEQMVDGEPFKRALVTADDISDCENKDHIKLGAAIKFNEQCRNIDELYSRALIAHNKTVNNDNLRISSENYAEKFLSNLPEDKDFDADKYNAFLDGDYNEDEGEPTFSNAELGVDEINFLIWLAMIPESISKSLFKYVSPERELEKKQNEDNLRLLESSDKLPKGSVSTIAEFLGGAKKSRSSSRARKRNNKKSMKKSIKKSIKKGIKKSIKKSMKKSIKKRN